MSHTQGVLYVHSAPSALRPHIEWAVGGALGVPAHLMWDRQPAEAGTFRAEVRWDGRVGTGAHLASSLRGWPQLRFEVTEDPTADSEGQRFAWTPQLGMFRATTGRHGNIMVDEERLRWAMAQDDVAAAMDDLLGEAWDAELDVFRYAGDGAPVRWLHRAV